MTLSTWINFNGNAQEAFTFYKSVFGGEFTNTIRFKDLAGPEFPVVAEEEDKLMRITLRTAAGGVLHGNDVPAVMGVVSESEHRSKIHVSAADKEEAMLILSGLSAGGEVEVPIEEGAPGAVFGMCRDRYGIEWIVESAVSV